MKKSKKLPKNTFFCDRCDSPCMIYRKGSSHRVLICPKCGVLATNGKGKLLGKTIVKRGAKALLGEIPGASLIMEGAGAVSDIKKGMKTGQTSHQVPTTQKIYTDSADVPNQGERIINKELYGV